MHRAKWTSVATLVVVIFGGAVLAGCSSTPATSATPSTAGAHPTTTAPSQQPSTTNTSQAAGAATTTITTVTAPGGDSVLADGSYCGTIGHVDVASQTFDFQAWTSTGPSGVTELAGATSVLTPTDTTFTVASDIGGPPTASPTQTVLQGWLQFLAEAVSAEPDATYDITQNSGNVTSLYFKDPRYSEAGATEYHGCVTTSG